MARIIGDTINEWERIAPALQPAPVAPAAPTPAPAPSGPAPPTTINQDTDWGSLITSSPIYQAFLSSRTGGVGAAATQRAEATKSLLSKYGFLPPGFKDTYGDLTDTDIQAAANNPFSFKATNKRNYEQGIEAMHKALSARGMLQSGELGYGQQQADYGRDLADYNAGGDFSSALRGIIGNYLGVEQGYNSQEPTAISQASSDVQARYPQGNAHPATLIAGSIQQYGQPVYKDPDGVLWTLDPTTQKPVRFTPPPAAPAAPAVTSGYDSFYSEGGRWGGI